MIDRGTGGEPDVGAHGIGGRLPPMPGELRRPRVRTTQLAAAVAILAGVVLMHVLSAPGAPHEPFGTASPGMDHRSAMPTRHGATGDPTGGHLLAAGLCAFAVLTAVRSVHRRASTLPPLHLPAAELLTRLLTGPEPPVPRHVA